MIEPGTQIGRYEIQRRLGRGGMGAVYVAHDPVLGRMAAIKVFSGDLDIPEARERFSREARSAALLNHPHIVTVYDFGEFESQPYIVMEYVPGETLAQVIRRKAPVSMADKLRWVEELCIGIGYAHQMSVIHRDIKPSNLMIDRSGRLKILDFGIARVMGLASSTTALVGTPGYMAPEQIQGTEIDHRADLFSVGVVFYELLSYTEAFTGDSVATITHRILSTEPIPIQQIAPQADPAVAAVIDRLLQKSPADRYPDAEAVRQAVARLRLQQQTDDAASNAPTMIRPSPQPRPPTSPGAGFTPAPHTTPRPRQTPISGGVDREAIARRREEQIRASLDVARACLNRSDLDGALDACQQALMLNEQHADALALEREIQSALEARDGGPGDFAMTSQLTTATERPGLAPESPDAQPTIGVQRGTDGSSPGVRPSTQHGEVAETIIARPATEPGVSREGGRPATGTGVRRDASGPGVRQDRASGQSEPVPAPSVEATILAPRRTPAPRATPLPPAAPVTPPVAAAPPAQAGAEKTVLVPPAAAAAQRAKAAAKGGAGSKASAGPANAARQRMILYGAAAVVVLLLVGAATMFVGGGPAPTGTAVIEAVPWGTITAIESESGEQVPVPADATTPVALTLPAGTYRISLAGPTPDAPPQQVTVQVSPQGTQVAPLVRFPILTVEQYFEQYLGSSSTLEGEVPVAADAAPVGAIAPPVQPAVAPAASEGVGQ